MDIDMRPKQLVASTVTRRVSVPDTKTFQLTQAIGFNRVDGVRQLIVDRSLVNALDEFNNYPLGDAAGRGCAEIAQLLIEAGHSGSSCILGKTVAVTALTRQTTSHRHVPLHEVKLPRAQAGNLQGQLHSAGRQGATVPSGEWSVPASCCRGMEPCNPGPA
jgi:hypothetical protein